MNTIYRSESSCVKFNEETNTFTLEWIGIIGLEEFQNGINTLMKHTSRSLNCNVIMNYKKMINITAHARVWYEDVFLSSEGCELVYKVNKLAVIKPSGMMQRAIVDKFKKLYLEIYPDLSYHQFVIPFIADKWMEVIDESKNSKIQLFKSLVPQTLKLKFA